MFRLTLSIAVLATVCLASPQDEFATSVLNLESKVGSFKILKFNREAPAVGRLEISFSGTLLVSDYKGKPIEPTIKGNIKREFPDPKVLPKLGRDERKIVYHGKGTVVLDGSFMGVQWFGRDLKAKWSRAGGAMRLSGEFDAQGNTGTYWFSDPTKKMPWPVSGELRMPEAMIQHQGGPDKPILGKPKTGGGR